MPKIFTKVSEPYSHDNKGLIYVWIFFETSTYDEIERDKKVTLDSITVSIFVHVFVFAIVFVFICIFIHLYIFHLYLHLFVYVFVYICLGDLGGAAWTHWRHYGTSNRLLHPQWGGNPLPPCNAFNFPLEKKYLLQEGEGNFQG